MDDLMIVAEKAAHSMFSCTVICSACLSHLHISCHEADSTKEAPGSGRGRSDLPECGYNGAAVAQQRSHCLHLTLKPGNALQYMPLDAESYLTPRKRFVQHRACERLSLEHNIQETHSTCAQML